MAWAQLTGKINYQRREIHVILFTVFNIYLWRGVWAAASFGWPRLSLYPRARSDRGPVIIGIGDSPPQSNGGFGDFIWLNDTDLAGTASSIGAASYTVARWRGILFLFLLLLIPGILNLIGYWPKFAYQPQEYVVDGNGHLGVVAGIIPLLLIACLVGWSITIIVYDNLNLNDKFRNSYDHLWYFSALMAGAFFVTDNQANLHWLKLREENVLSQKASSYLLAQVRQYDGYCRSNGKTALVSCRWASEVQQQLIDYSTYDEQLFHTLGPLTSREVYGAISRFSDDEIITIRREISAYNRRSGTALLA